MEGLMSRALLVKNHPAALPSWEPQGFRFGLFAPGMRLA
jgi:hypothetical protein